jgi:hypothetical protein
MPSEGVKRGLNRRGYFFLVDAVIASLILFGGLFVLFSSGTQTEDSVQPLATIEDVLGTLATQPVSATLNPYYVDELLPQGLVPYPAATPLELVAYLNITDCGNPYCDDYAVNYSRSLFASALGPEYGYELRINGSRLAYADTQKRYQLARTFVLYVRTSDTEYVGPLEAEVYLWN